MGTNRVLLRYVHATITSAVFPERTGRSAASCQTQHTYPCRQSEPHTSLQASSAMLAATSLNMLVKASGRVCMSCGSRLNLAPASFVQPRQRSAHSRAQRACVLPARGDQKVMQRLSEIQTGQEGEFDDFDDDFADAPVPVDEEKVVEQVVQPRGTGVQSAKYFSSSVTLASCPPPRFPEFAVIGRSNVGKSSLINMLVRDSKLALTSKQPGMLQDAPTVLAWPDAARTKPTACSPPAYTDGSIASAAAPCLPPASTAPRTTRTQWPNTWNAEARCCTVCLQMQALDLAAHCSAAAAACICNTGHMLSAQPRRPFAAYPAQAERTSPHLHVAVIRSPCSDVCPAHRAIRCTPTLERSRALGPVLCEGRAQGRVR